LSKNLLVKGEKSRI